MAHKTMSAAKLVSGTRPSNTMRVYVVHRLYWRSMHLFLCDIFFLSPVLGSVILVNFYSAISTEAQKKQIIDLENCRLFWLQLYGKVWPLSDIYKVISVQTIIVGSTPSKTQVIFWYWCATSQTTKGQQSVGEYSDTLQFSTCAAATDQQTNWQWTRKNKQLLLFHCMFIVILLWHVTRV